jgi:hypothetical protein
MSEEERAQMREEFQNMTPEERETAMAERGFEQPEGGPEGGPPEGGTGGRGQGPGGGMRGGNAMLDPLIALLTERAAQ